MGSVTHLRQSTSRLDEIENEVFDTVDRMCLRVGELLSEAKAIEGPRFKTWVEARMPFGYDRARRLVAIYVAYRELPAEKLQQLPRPWQALYALAPHARGNLAEALESGEVGPDTTVKQATELARTWSKNYPKASPVEERYTLADRRAGALMEHPAVDLNPYVRDALLRWLDRAPTTEDGAPVSD